MLHRHAEAHASSMHARVGVGGDCGVEGLQSCETEREAEGDAGVTANGNTVGRPGGLKY